MAQLTRDHRVRAFRATDAFALEAYRISRTVQAAQHRSLLDEIRRAAMRSGGALVAASGTPAGGPAERRYLERARGRLLEGRYYLYIARRIGMLDLKHYRGLTVRQDVALKELDLLLGSTTPRLEEHPP